MKDNNIIGRRLLHSYLSSVISISLVLVLVGIAAMVLANAGSVSDYFKENMKMSAELSLSVDEPGAMALAKKAAALPGVREVEYVSREQGIRELESQLGSGFLEVFENPPIPAALSISLESGYVCRDSIDVVCGRIKALGGVDGIYYHESVLESMNANIEKVGGVIALFIALLMFISFVLIGNTVRLNLYSKRFTIYAMQLVGATKAFIRRPFMLQALFQGLISGLAAVVVLVVMLFYVKSGFRQLFDVVSVEIIAGVLIFVVALGILICVLSTAVVVNRLVGFSKDDLYV